MKKYRVNGTGVHTIKLVECETKPKKAKGVMWFDSLEDAIQALFKIIPVTSLRLMCNWTFDGTLKDALFLV